MDEEILYQYARENTPRLLKGTLISMEEQLELLQNPSWEQDTGNICDMEGELEEMMYVLSNEKKSCGAIVLLYDGVREKIAQLAGGDFLVLPSSIHETILIPRLDMNDIDVGEFRAMVQDINKTQVLPEEVLSNNVYRYDARMKNIEIIS